MPRNGIQEADFAPSLPKPGSCSSAPGRGFCARGVSLHGGGRGQRGPQPLSTHLRVCPDAVGAGRAPRTASHPPSSPTARAEPALPIPRLREAWHSRADNPNPHSLLNATAPRESPEPRSQRHWEAIPFLNWDQSDPTLWKPGSSLSFPENPPSACPSPSPCHQLQMSPRAFPLLFPPPYCF